MTGDHTKLTAFKDSAAKSLISREINEVLLFNENGDHMLEPLVKGTLSLPIQIYQAKRISFRSPRRRTRLVS